MMAEKKDKVIPKKGDKTHTEMLLDPALTGGYRRVRRRSALDDEFEADDDMQARELRDLRTEEMMIKRRARIAKLEREIKEIEKVPAEAEAVEKPKIPGISINVARQIAALPDEERTRVLETYMLMQAAEAKQANAVLPAIVGFARANPGSSPNQYMDFATAMADQFRTGVEVAQKMIPAAPAPASQQDQWKPMELIVDLVKDSVREPIEKLSQSMQPQPGFFEHLLMNPELFDRAKDLGIFGRRDVGGAGTSEMDLKIAQVTTANQLEIKKLDLEWKKAMLERETQNKKTDALVTALAPFSAIFAGPIDQRMRQFGRQQASAHNPGGIPPGTMPQQNAVLIKCSCGFQGPISFPGPPPDRVNCPSCGLELVVGDAPGVSGNPEETDKGT